MVENRDKKKKQSENSLAEVNTERSLIYINTNRLRGQVRTLQRVRLKQTKLIVTLREKKKLSLGFELNGAEPGCVLSEGKGEVRWGEGGYLCSELSL